MTKPFACTENATIARTTNTTNAVIETMSSVDFALALLSRLSAMPGRYTRARTRAAPLIDQRSGTYCLLSTKPPRLVGAKMRTCNLTPLANVDA